MFFQQIQAADNRKTVSFLTVRIPIDKRPPAARSLHGSISSRSPDVGICLPPYSSDYPRHPAWGAQHSPLFKQPHHVAKRTKQRFVLERAEKIEAYTAVDGRNHGDAVSSRTHAGFFDWKGNEYE